MDTNDRLFREVLADFVHAKKNLDALADLSFSEHYAFHLDTPIRYCEHETCQLAARLFSA